MSFDRIQSLIFGEGFLMGHSHTYLGILFNFAMMIIVSYIVPLQLLDYCLQQVILSFFIPFCLICILLLCLRFQYVYTSTMCLIKLEST